MRLNRFVWYAWAVLAYNVGVILWGAYVRATGSGAGCGQHWPLCNGEVLPQSPQVATLVEFTHRLSSGVALLAVVGLALWAFRAYPRSHPVRRAAAFAVAFIITEALLGAGLVLFQLVAHNASVARAVSVALHLANTLLLLAALTLTAWLASTGATRRRAGHEGMAAGFLLGMVGGVLVGASGAVVALGDTLFPSASLAAGLQQDFDPTASFLIRLRMYHPAVAVGVGLGLIALAGYASQRVGSPAVDRAARRLMALVVAQWLAGMVNLMLLAPVWLQLVHLLLADLVWVALVLLAANALADSGERASVEPTSPRTRRPRAEGASAPSARTGI